jgi:hypothetical protein
MPHTSPRVCAPGLALFVSLVLLSPLPLYAQHDSAMMKHDPAMMHADSGMMESGMMKKDHEMMGHQGMEPNMMFMGAPGHKAAGDYEIAEVNGKQRIKLTPDFGVDQAPDLYLVLATSETPDARSVYVAKLKSATGSQSYDIPKGTDLSKYTKLLVWSKKSNALVASADLASSGHMMQK